MAKRFSKPSINWVELEKRVPPEQKPKFLVFKAKADTYLRRVNASPPEPPKIDWEAYKKTVPVAGLVDKFKSSYEAYKVPVPEDKMSAQVDEQWKQLEPAIKKYSDERKKEIEAISKDLARLDALPKFEDMTMEMVYDLYPDQCVDPVNRPTFWPHQPEEQYGYKPPAPPAAAKAAEPPKKK